MARKNKLTPNQDKYKELRNRLRRKLRDLKKRGMTPNRAFNENWLGEEIPKTVRKSELEKMQKALKNIYEYVRYYDPLKEVYIIGTERRRQERAEASRKAWETRRRKARERDQFWEEFDEQFPEVTEEYYDSLPEFKLQILEQIEDMIDEWQPAPTWSSELNSLKTEDKNLLKSIFDGARSSLGDEQLATNIQQNSVELLSLLNQIMYESGNKYKLSGRDGIHFAIQRVRDIFYGRASTVRESMELTDFAERINEAE